MGDKPTVRVRIKAPSRPLATVVQLAVEPLIREDVDPAAVLEAVASERLISVAVAGQNELGEFCFWASAVRNGDTLMLIERARDMVIKCERDSGWRPVSGGGEVVPLRSRS